VLLTVPCFVFLERPRTALGGGPLKPILELLAAKSISVLAIDNSNTSFYTSTLELDTDGAWRWR